MSDIPRSEYPRPQFVRDEWLCLNGEWGFEIDQGDSGIHRGLLERELRDTITVPFCPESQALRHWQPRLLQRRLVSPPRHDPGEHWAGKRILLHFQAVDYDSTVWVNGEEVGRHRGGLLALQLRYQRMTWRTRATKSPSCCGRATTARSHSRAANKPPITDQKAPSMCAPPASGSPSGWNPCPISPCAALASRLISPIRRFRLEQPITGNAPGLRLRATLSDADGEVVSAETSAEARPVAAPGSADPGRPAQALGCRRSASVRSGNCAP